MKPKLMIIQGSKDSGRYAEDAKWLLFWLIRRLSFSLKDDCVFEFCFDGPRTSIPKEKKERTEFLEPHLKALSKRLSEQLIAHPPPPPNPEDVKKEIERAESWRRSYLASLKKLAALSPDDVVIDLDDDPDNDLSERNEYHRLKWWIEHLEKVERMRIGYKYRLMLAKAPPCGVVGIGALACECLTGDSILKWRAGTYWRTLPLFRKAGIHKVWISRPTTECLLKPDLFVDITRTIGKAALEIGLPIEIDYTLQVPMRLWSKYQGQRGRERAHFER